MPPTRTRYSAEVLLKLIACGFEISLSHVGPDFVVVRDSKQAIDKCDGELVISVDGVEDRKIVHLPDGIELGTFKEVGYEFRF